MQDDQTEDEQDVKARGKWHAPMKSPGVKTRPASDDEGNGDRNETPLEDDLIIVPAGGVSYETMDIVEKAQIVKEIGDPVIQAILAADGAQKTSLVKDVMKYVSRKVREQCTMKVEEIVVLDV